MRVKGRCGSIFSTAISPRYTARFSFSPIRSSTSGSRNMDRQELPAALIDHVEDQLPYRKGPLVTRSSIRSSS